MEEQVEVGEAGEVGEVGDESATGGGSGHPLSIGAAKWAKVRASAYFDRYPGARLLCPGALAQTLQATYRSGCLLYSQFVPVVVPAGVIAPPPRFFSPRECSRSWLKVAPGLCGGTAPPPTPAFLEACRAPAPPGAQPWHGGGLVRRQHALPKLPSTRRCSRIQPDALG